MPHLALSDALAQVPFLDTLGVSVEDARPGDVVLRLSGRAGNQTASGTLYGATLFAIGELAATVACATHPLLHDLAQALVATRIAYTGEASGDVTAHAALAPEQLSAISAEVALSAAATADIIVHVLDGYGNDVATVTVSLRLSR